MVELRVFQPGTLSGSRRWAEVYCSLVKSQWWILVAAGLYTFGGVTTGTATGGVVSGLAGVALLIGASRWLGNDALEQTRVILVRASGGRVPLPAGQVLEDTWASLEDIDSPPWESTGHDSRWEAVYRRLS